MLMNTKRSSMRRQRGFSLVEILISMTLGLFLLLGLTTFMANTLVSDTKTMLMSRLNQEARSAMLLMVREIRRAGYWGTPTFALGPLTGAGAGSLFINPFAAITPITPGVPGSCILFRYDKNHNALPEASEFFGFLRTNAGVVQMYAGTGATTCAGGVGWAALTDARNSNVTALSFALSAAAPAYVLEGPLGALGPSIRVRYVTIQMTVQSKADPSLTLRLQETVKLENDLFCPTNLLC